MVLLALVLDLLFLFVAFGARTLVQRRRTGDSGWRLGRPHSTAEAVGRGLMVMAGGLIVVALIVDSDAPTGVARAGIGVSIAAVVMVSVAQLQMGASWRIGVDPDERTDLIRSGLYAAIRNPIYTGMVAFVVGQALMLPSVWSAAAVIAMLVGVEVQVRAVEEPYLIGAHGAEFRRWASASGRFLPHVGRLRPIEVRHDVEPIAG